MSLLVCAVAAPAGLKAIHLLALCVGHQRRRCSEPPQRWQRILLSRRRWPVRCSWWARI